MSKENTVVSGRYFAGLWKCWLYPIFMGVATLLLFHPSLGNDSIGFVMFIMLILTALGGFIAAMWFLHADAVNLKETHGLDKRAWPYWISLYFIGIFSLLIYYWTRSGLIRRAGMTEEPLTWEDRLLPYKNRNNSSHHKTKFV